MSGSLDSNQLTVYHHRGPNEEEKEVVKVETNGTGHGGGDSFLNRDFINMLNGKESFARPGLKEGITSALMCLAADKSKDTGQVIDLDYYFNKVF